MNKYGFTLIARCPNNDDIDYYEVVLETSRMIQCEELVELSNSYTQSKVYQEDLTKQLSQRYACKVTITGLHCGGKIKVVSECG